MKILFFSPYFYPYTSGITTYPFKLFSHLAKQHQVDVLTFKHDSTLKSHENIENMQIRRIPFLFRISKGFISPQSLLYFYQEVKKSDVVFLNIPNFEGFPLAIISWLLGKRIISIYHCRVVMGKDIISQLISLCLNASMYIQLLLSQRIVGYTDDYVNNSWVGTLFRAKIKTVLPPIQHLSADESRLAELRNLRKDSTAIGYAGRTSHEKGLEYLVEAVERLSSQKKQKYIILFAGPYGKDVAGEEQYYNDIKKMLDEKHLKYHFLGCLSSGDLAAFYKAVDILVLPSINSTEAFGMVQAESMICGTPVVTTDLPGVRVPVQLTGMGKIVKLRNVNNLSEAIDHVVSNKNQYTNEKLVSAAQEIFKIEKTYQFYDKLLKNGN